MEEQIEENEEEGVQGATPPFPNFLPRQALQNFFDEFGEEEEEGEGAQMHPPPPPPQRGRGRPRGGQNMPRADQRLIVPNILG